MNLKDIGKALEDVLPFIETAAPVVATAIGSPMAGTVIGLLCNAFDANKNDLPQLAANINSDPDAHVKLGTVQNIMSGLVGTKAPISMTLSLRFCFQED